MCITVSRRDTCFWDSLPYATKCEKDGKVHIERVPGSEQNFEHLAKHENMVISLDSHSLLR